MASERGTGMLGDAGGGAAHRASCTDRILAFVPKKMWMTVLFVSAFFVSH